MKKKINKIPKVCPENKKKLGISYQLKFLSIIFNKHKNLVNR